MKIAPNQRRELDFLRETLDTLERISDRAGRPAFRALRDRLDQWAARVAVIGQVKAGKSTFVNALLYQHDFLPSDVNPWTSVVTNIRINMPGDPALGARFDFFDESDWQEIVDGGSKIRELTEQLLPGFDTELLRQQSEEMRARAQKRLGKHYHTLLGSQHEYDFLTPDLLKRYVCAGPGSDAGLERESLGRYAALTKVANAFMRMPGFLVPTIITDTPGVNDPFLVRDEFTCRSLDRSDIFIMVLSAHQPLTEVDIALIRILAQQDDKDVVIFVNRIDELDDYATEVPRVMADVSARLSAAVPGIDFRITAGSAYMADLVLRDDDAAEAERSAIDTPELAAYLAALHGRVPATCEDRLMLASGLDPLRGTLSDVIDTGTGGRYLGGLLEDIRAEISGALFTAKRERDSLQLQVESVTSAAARDAVVTLTQEIDGIKQVHASLQARVETAEGQIEAVVGKAWSTLQTRLVNRIEAFIDTQKELFEERLFHADLSDDGNGHGPLMVDITPLQAQIEAEVRSAYAASRTGTDAALGSCLHVCRQAVREMFDDPAEKITLNELPYDSFSSTLALSRRSLKIDLITGRGWTFWRRPSINVEKTLAALRVIAAAEMRPAVEKILSAFNEAQVERAAAGTSRLRVFLRMIEVGLSERSHRLKQDRIEMERVATDVDLQRRMVQRLQSQMEVLERRLLNLSAVDSALSRSELASAA